MYFWKTYPLRWCIQFTKYIYSRTAKPVNRMKWPHPIIACREFAFCLPTLRALLYAWITWRGSMWWFLKDNQRGLESCVFLEDLGLVDCSPGLGIKECSTQLCLCKPRPSRILCHADFKLCVSLSEKLLFLLPSLWQLSSNQMPKTLSRHSVACLAPHPSSKF